MATLAVNVPEALRLCVKNAGKGRQVAHGLPELSRGPLAVQGEAQLLHILSQGGGGGLGLPDPPAQPLLGTGRRLLLCSHLHPTLLC